ncbi:hypothetical protein AJ80_09967 [Polytolypa hystricis UAMH7299]|uniref:Uncharacterized protein n=1 Tax=Polytolypa hystricis (strain UAMH7299) TaxID=1447883 RepID=A0A2B7WFU5_POLH7|nr:hypothetical protein AJ80_09967 [Polytolypa hystricis UAMH7299]
MDTESQPSHQDQLLTSTGTVLHAISAFEPTDVVEFKEGLESLQDTLLSFRGLSNPKLSPFYMLCVQLLEAFTSHLSMSRDNVADLRNISIIGYNHSQFQRTLLALFHALSTFLNTIRCIPSKLNSKTKQRWMSCIAHAVHDLETHQTHLEHLDQTVLVLTQFHYTTACLSMFYELLLGLGINSFNEIFCECVSRGSNRTTLMDDVVVIRVGRDAINHCTELGEFLLNEINRKRGLVEDKFLKDIQKRFELVVEEFQTVSNSLNHGENLVSYEILTRGYRLQFAQMTDEELGSLQVTLNELVLCGT